MAQVSRRQFLVAGLGMMVAGCSQTSRLVTGRRPRPLWPQIHTPPQVNGQAITLPQHVQPSAAPPMAMGPIRTIPRSRWAKSKPIGSRLRPMRSVEHITVHHEGWTPVWFDDPGSTSERLESIRTSHLRRLGAGDIGYHLVIDRAGRVWQGRDLRYQGAHVRDHNPKNVGVMVLGNFDLQRPTDAQKTILRHVLGNLMQLYRVPLKQVFTHQELNVTSCPGKVLQSQVAVMRRSGLLA